MCQNERVLIHAINFIGSRVSVDVVYLHLQSLYGFMGLAMDGAMVAQYVAHVRATHTKADEQWGPHSTNNAVY